VDDGFLHVSSTEELLDAVGPGVKIAIEPGYYNMSDCARELWNRASYGEWDAEHPWVTLRDCYDGVEIVIQGVSGLTITGTGEAADTELVIDPRYGTVLAFEDCDELTLERLTLGHTDGGECSGSVVGLLDCETVTLEGLDLYGCGVLGVRAESSGDVFVRDSVIRDCSYGPFEFDNCRGSLEFRGCELRGSGGGGYCWPEEAELSFIDCSFGEWESNVWYFREDCVKENCSWSEITVYPDFGGGDAKLDSFDPAFFSVAPFDAAVLEDTAWYSYSRLRPDSGDYPIYEYVDFGSVTLTLNGDRSGTLETPAGTRSLTWSCEGAYTLLLEPEEGEEIRCSLYASDGEEGWLWMYLPVDGEWLWMY
jgi:hypothetical protein